MVAPSCVLLVLQPSTINVLRNGFHHGPCCWSLNEPGMARIPVTPKLQRKHGRHGLLHAPALALTKLPAIEGPMRQCLMAMVTNAATLKVTVPMAEVLCGVTE